MLGGGGIGLLQFDSPTAIAVDQTTGNIVIADTGNERIQICTREKGVFVRSFSHSSGNKQFSSLEELQSIGKRGISSSLIIIIIKFISVNETVGFNSNHWDSE